MNPNTSNMANSTPPTIGITPTVPTEAQRVFDLEQKINAIYVSVEKTRKYFLWTMIITIALFVLPLIGLVFAIPSFINTYANQASNLGL